MIVPARRAASAAHATALLIALLVAFPGYAESRPLRPALDEAMAWYSGPGGTVVVDRARALPPEATETADPVARTWMARCHSMGRMGVAHDRNRARTLVAAVLTDLSNPADAGDREAVFPMGTAHDEALGLREDPAQAAAWCRKAAGRAGPVDLEKARFRYEGAVRLGDQAAAAAPERLTPIGGAAETRPQERNPLAPFARFVGGAWHLGEEGTSQELTWGVGRRSVRARAYAVSEGERRLVSEGAWFWHPGKGAIRGYFTAIDMPPVFFDYTTRFDGETMLSEIVAYTADGQAQRYAEEWRWIDEDHYEWILILDTEEGPQRSAGGIYTRRR